MLNSMENRPPASCATLLLHSLDLNAKGLCWFFILSSVKVSFITRKWGSIADNYVVGPGIFYANNHNYEQWYFRVLPHLVSPLHPTHNKTSSRLYQHTSISCCCNDSKITFDYDANIFVPFPPNRCTNSELKYGPAVTCDQCKQRCAFNRPDYKVSITPTWSDDQHLC